MLCQYLPLLPTVMLTLYVQFMESQGYDEAVLVSNVKIIFGTIAVIVAVYSHFNKYTFPANKTLVLTCVTIYFISIGIINLVSYFQEASAVFIGSLNPKVRTLPRGKVLQPRLWVITSLPTKGSSLFRIEMRTTARQALGSVFIEHPYEKYITEEGRFLITQFRTDMTSLLQMVPSAAKKSL